MTKRKPVGNDELTTFGKHFEGYENSYILIGGVATKLLLDEVGTFSRSTKDLDIVLCVETLTSKFVERFWTFVKEGEYETWRKADGERCFYRFERPNKDGYPAMLELLGDKSNRFESTNQVVLPLFLDDEIISLSAIMMNQDYYQFLMNHKKIIKGVMIADEFALIALKIRAFLDLSDRKLKGEFVKQEDIKKHRNDVFRLAQLLSSKVINHVPYIIKNDVYNFFELVVDDYEILEVINKGAMNMKDLRELLSVVFALELK